MLDIKLLRKRPEYVKGELLKRQFFFDADLFGKLDKDRKFLQCSIQDLKSKKKKYSNFIKISDDGKCKNIDYFFNKINFINEILKTKMFKLKKILEQIEVILLSLPNFLHYSVPLGNKNEEIRTCGSISKFSFPVKSHDELGKGLGQIDFNSASKIVGSRFVVMSAYIARLHRALIQFMMDVHVLEHDYQEIYIPYIINKKSLFCTGQLPKFSNDLFKLCGKEDFYLISTSEIPVTNIVRDVILIEKNLPIKYVCCSPCFRKEAGSYGKDSKGMIRQHQFEKVELVWITVPEKSYESLEILINHAEVILKRLELPYRVMNLCRKDIGTNSSKTYDLEVWFPSQNCYREVSSCSNMEDFQSRRMKTRYREYNTNRIKLVHTLNGSGLAVGRILAAIMENYQDENGNICVPSVLKTYLSGLDIIKPCSKKLY
ncbi:serine--tRNA ligase [Candidatus Legionella polyplacis]|uniref:Serine--tRNA ligase n=1 Tax=Candidatus Legionella polyplacis TaxID=2005262 RepID=A0ABZ2GXF1_9GAMM|nr:serine--tRNA ligase [Candidatus Legionella polyplacis]ATW01956.1 serine--tRNA ligase [Candidatus Legionella polyplacis]